MAMASWSGTAAAEKPCSKSQCPVEQGAVALVDELTELAKCAVKCSTTTAAQATCEKAVCEKAACDKTIFQASADAKQVCEKAACTKSACDKAACGEAALLTSADVKQACDKACKTATCTTAACTKASCDEAASDVAECSKKACESGITRFHIELIPELFTSHTSRGNTGECAGTCTAVCTVESASTGSCSVSVCPTDCLNVSKTSACKATECTAASCGAACASVAKCPVGGRDLLTAVAHFLHERDKLYQELLEAKVANARLETELAWHTEREQWLERVHAAELEKKELEARFATLEEAQTLRTQCLELTLENERLKAQIFASQRDTEPTAPRAARRDTRN